MSTAHAPLDLVVLGAFLAGRQEPLHLHPQWIVDAGSLDDLLVRHAPRLELDVEILDREAWPTSLTFTHMRHFCPESLAAQIPETTHLLQLRALLHELGRGKASRDDLRHALRDLLPHLPLAGAIERALVERRPPAPPPPRDPDSEPASESQEVRQEDTSLRHLLEMVDLGGSQRDRVQPAEGSSASRPSAAPDPRPTTATRALDRLLGDLLGGGEGVSHPSLRELRPLIDEIDEEIVHVLRAVLHQAEFRALESSWRGLQFLMRRIDFREGVRIRVIHTQAATAASIVQETVEPLARLSREEGRVPVIIADFLHRRPAEDLPRLHTWAQAAAATRAPIITGLDPALLGLPSLVDLRGETNIDDLVQGSDALEWRRLGSQESARWLFVAANRFLLRLPYGEHGTPVKGFAFEETPTGDDPLYLLGNAPWIIAVLVARGFVRDGWGVSCCGAGEEGTVGDLPLRRLERRTGEAIQSPLEAPLSENRVLQLSRARIATLSGRRNCDEVFVVTAPAVYRPMRPSEQAPPEQTYAAEARRATLPYQLFLAQIDGLVETIWNNLDPRSAPAEMARTLAAGLDFLTATERGSVLTAQASVRPASDSDDEAKIELKISPIAGALRGMSPIALELPLPRIST